MKRLRWLSPYAAAFAIIFLLPGLAPAQGPQWARVVRVSMAPRVPVWDFFISAFGGIAIPFNPDVDVIDPTTTTNFTANGLELDTAFSFGGKVGAWNTATRRTIGLDIGAEIDVTRFSPEFGPQTTTATGTSMGSPITSFTLANTRDVTATIVAANLMVRDVRGVVAGLPNGRWHVYLGLGGGFEIAEMDLLGGGSDKDTAVLLQVLTGLKIFLVKNIAVFAEYKFSHAEHSFAVPAETDEFTLNTNHVAAGLAIHFSLGGR